MTPPLLRGCYTHTRAWGRARTGAAGGKGTRVCLSVCPAHTCDRARFVHGYVCVSMCVSLAHACVSVCPAHTSVSVCVPCPVSRVPCVCYGLKRSCTRAQSTRVPCRCPRLACCTRVFTRVCSRTCVVMNKLHTKLLGLHTCVRGSRTACGACAIAHSHSRLCALARSFTHACPCTLTHRHTLTPFHIHSPHGPFKAGLGPASHSAPPL